MSLDKELKFNLNKNIKNELVALTTGNKQAQHTTHEGLINLLYHILWVKASIKEENIMESLQKEYERIKKYANGANVGNYDMTYNEIAALMELSENTFDLIFLAFNFGFAKGCRKTRKAVKS